MFMIIRIDDNGNAFLIKSNLTENQADEYLSIFSGHKQCYSKIEYFDFDKTIKDDRIL